MGLILSYNFFTHIIKEEEFTSSSWTVPKSGILIVAMFINALLKLTHAPQSKQSMHAMKRLVILTHNTTKQAFTLKLTRPGRSYLQRFVYFLSNISIERPYKKWSWLESSTCSRPCMYVLIQEYNNTISTFEFSDLVR